MIPDNKLSTIPVLGNIQSPQKDETNFLISYEQGGIALNDSSAGLQYQTWKGTVENFRDIYFTSQLGIKSLVYSAAYQVTSISISFDQLMHPTIAFVENDQAKLYWYDSAIPGQAILILPTDARTPRVYLDDKRLEETSSSDIVLFYMRGTCLYFRQQRDRFQIEYLLGSNIVGDILRVGMSNKNRIQLEFGTKLTDSELYQELAKGSPISDSTIVTKDAATTPSSSDIWELERKD